MNIEEWLGKDNKLGIEIWERKYRFNELEDFESWINRVSGGDKEFARLIRRKRFLPGGRILSNRGLENIGRKITLNNCYVLPSPEDNLESIYDVAKMMARTFSYGGGAGCCLGKLAPLGARINNAAKSTSGAISFGDLYDITTSLIGSSGR
jgi:ribonucleoside-diphosphate reductase alpha chain